MGGASECSDASHGGAVGTRNETARPVYTRQQHRKRVPLELGWVPPPEDEGDDVGGEEVADVDDRADHGDHTDLARVVEPVLEPLRRERSAEQPPLDVDDVLALDADARVVGSVAEQREENEAGHVGDEEAIARPRPLEREQRHDGDAERENERVRRHRRTGKEEREQDRGERCAASKGRRDDRGCAATCHRDRHDRHAPRRVHFVTEEVRSSNQLPVTGAGIHSYAIGEYDNPDRLRDRASNGTDSHRCAASTELTKRSTSSG